MENIISSISNMSTAEYELNNLLQIDIAEKGKQAYHPVRLVVNGVPTQKALAFNKRMLREGKTTQYLDSSKIKNHIGLTAKTNLTDGLQKSIKKYKDVL